MNWKRQSNLNTPGQTEVWLRKENNTEESFPVSVRFGKKTDLLSLKKNIVSSIESNIQYYSNTRNEFFSKAENLQSVSSCPACHASVNNSEFITEIYHARYHQCGNCTHIYLPNIPTLSAIEDFYRNNNQYAQTYTSKESAEFRLNSVDVVLADHLFNQYHTAFGSNPKKVLDIGAGGGHFVEACRRKAVEAAGLEFSQSSIAFAKDVWGIDLDNRDFTKAYTDYKGFDAVTFWGLLEHVSNPKEFLQSADASLKAGPEKMIMCRVPRWDSISSAVQRFYSDSIVRHLDPLGHIMIFTESSLCELFRSVGYKPVSIWYYGMDTYELMMQIGHRIKSYEHFLQTNELQQELQVQLDSNYLSDLMVMGFVPANS